MSIEEIADKFVDRIKSAADDPEYIQYAISIEYTLQKLVSNLKKSLSPQSRIILILEATAEFYQADWSGIIDVDPEVGVWTPMWWYNGGADSVLSEMVCDLESRHCYERWMNYMKKQSAMVIPDVERLRDICPKECELYHQMNIQSLIVLPLQQNPTGFFIVCNPQKYKTYVSMIEFLNFSIAGLLRQQHMIEAEKHILSSPQISKGTDVFINLFGQLRITTAKGTLHESELKSAKIAKILAYMLLSKKLAIPPREFADVLWPEEDADIPGKNMKGLIYRLQQSFSLISDHRLIESTNYGYRFNPSLNIITDLDVFLNKCEMAFSEDSADKKTELLRKAIALYSGDVLCSASSEHWLIPVVMNYQCYYIGMVNELMKLFNAQHRYHEIHAYASKAVTITPHHPDVYYWLIYAIHQRGNTEMARSVLRSAEVKLTSEDFFDLKMRLAQELSMH